MAIIRRRTVSVRSPSDRGEKSVGLAPNAAKRGAELFADDKGNGRLGRRNAVVAASSRRAGLATLLFDLLTEVEATRGSNIFDIPLLADRFIQAAQSITDCSAGRGLRVGYFGGATAHAAGLFAAAQGPEMCAAISHGGRPDLAGDLARIAASALLIVRAAGPEVLELSRRAWRVPRRERRLKSILDTTRLSKEASAGGPVAAVALGWFSQHPNAAEAP